MLLFCVILFGTNILQLRTVQSDESLWVGRFPVRIWQSSGQANSKITCALLFDLPFQRMSQQRVTVKFFQQWKRKSQGKEEGEKNFQQKVRSL